MKIVTLEKKLLFSMLLTCAGIVLFVSLFQGYLRLEKQKQQIEDEFSNFENGAKLSIGEAVWLYDWDMVQTIVENQTSQTLSYVEVCDRDANRCFESGRKDQSPFLEHRSVIAHHHPISDKNVDIGQVYVQAHYTPFPASVLKDLPQLLFTNGIGVFSVALIVFMLFHRQAVKRLVEVEKYTRGFELEKIEDLEPLKLKKNRQEGDEIDRLADAINSMTSQLKEDLRQRRELEQQLSQSQKMEALGTLAGGIAHDFNNILSAVLGFAQLSHRHCPKGSKLEQYQSQIITAGERAKRLIAQIMLFSRRADPLRRALNLAEIINENLPLIRASLPASVEIKTDLAENVKVLGDATQLHQIVMNLTANSAYALKEKGGSLDILLASEKLGAHKAELLDIAPGDYACLTIRDTGPGIPKAVRERIFEPFFSTKKVGEGTGMGLAVAHGIARAHGGAIELEDRTGPGAVFHIYLPETDQSVLEEVKSGLTVSGNGEVVVVVDDELAVTDLGREILTNLDYRVICYNDPLRAFHDIQSGRLRLDLLITDFTMPRLNGLELAQRIREHHFSFPILMWTGFSEGAREEIFKQSSVDAVLRKPFTIESLARAVHEALAGIEAR